MVRISGTANQFQYLIFTLLKSPPLQSPTNNPTLQVISKTIHLDFIFTLFFSSLHKE